MCIRWKCLYLVILTEAIREITATECDKTKMRFFTASPITKAWTLRPISEPLQEDLVKYAPDHMIKVLLFDTGAFTRAPDTRISPGSSIVKTYADKGENVVAVDFSKYEKSTEGDDDIIIAECVIIFINKLIKELPSMQLNLMKFHIIAFDKFVHIAGYIAAEMRDSRSEQFYRITALEPAIENPFDPSYKLNTRSADFVDVYHTNADELGEAETNGHLEVYFNDGVQQPGCADNNCSHRRVLIFFAKSLQSLDLFHSQRCMLKYATRCELQTPPIERLVGDDACVRKLCIPVSKIVCTVKAGRRTETGISKPTA